MPFATDEDDADFRQLAAGDASLRRLRRPDVWPTLPIAFGDAILPAADVNGCSLIDAMRTGHVAARRFTCALSRDRFEAFLKHESTTKTLIVHAMDAAPALPLLLYWALANVELLTAFRIRAQSELKCNLLFVLPADVPAEYRKAMQSVGQIRWVEPRYPTGSWRLMPHVAKTPIDAALTLDAVAAVDLAIACESSSKPLERPVAFDTPAEPRLLRVSRGASLGDLGAAADRWAAGAPLALRRVDAPFVIGDGELAFYRDESHLHPPASSCIRCGACVTICPTRCDPVALLNVAASPSRRRARRAGLDACIDCGLCTAVCPSAIPLHVVIDSLKRGLSTREPA